MQEILDLGIQPLANNLREIADKSDEKKFPLILVRCKKCTSIQLSVNVNPRLMFQDYLWVTGTTETARKHCKNLAQEVIKYWTNTAVVLEIGSNDGTLLKEFRKLTSGQIHGVDPANEISHSTQSIYGISNSDIELSEDSAKNPVTSYAKSKWEAEQVILDLGSDDFTVVAVRPSTVFGWGSRIRTDIIFNNMIASGILNKKIEVHTDGTPNRPVVHVLDVVDFLVTLLGANPNVVNRQAYNLGCLDGNYSVLEIAKIASSSLGHLPIVLNTENLTDQRSYRVSFKKAARELNFVARRPLEFAGEEIIENWNSLTHSDKKRFFDDTTRLGVLKKLIKQGKINSELRWS
jgi:hypothetical protein